jgi:hypothetical protein
MFSPVAGLMTRIVLSDMISFRPFRQGVGALCEAPLLAKRPYSLEVYGYVLRLQVLFDALYPSFAPKAGVFDAAEGG